MHREEQIRQRAYEIWQAQGSPEGRDEEYWLQACLEVDGAASQPSAIDGDETMPLTGVAPRAGAQQPRKGQRAA